jgi:hypothetical protein
MLTTLYLGFALAQPPTVLTPAPLPSPTPLPAPAPLPVPAAPATLTLKEFAQGFQPIPGTHSVMFVHPFSKKCVPVTFTLPPGCPKIKTGCRSITFDYGKHEVEIIFRIFNRVDVRTN